MKKEMMIQCKWGDNVSCCAVIGLLTVAIMTFIFMSFFYNLNGDEREHLSASYMIYRGLVPYRDFFEHHHPLSWYLFAPLFSVWGNSSAILWVARFVMLLVAIGTGYYLFKIGRILGASVRGLLVGLAGWLSFYFVQTYGVEFRPDNFMMLFCLAGTAYFFQYLQEKRQGLLSLSFGLFFIALLFLQKMIFVLFPLGVICLWLIWRKEIHWQDVAKALVFPVIAGIIVLCVLYQLGMLKDYWELNWLLNLKIEGMSFVGDDKLVIFWFGGIASLWLIWKDPVYERKVFGGLYLLLAGQMLFHRPWFGQYLLLYYPYLVLVLVLALSHFWQWKYHALILFVGLVGLIRVDWGLVQSFRRSPLRVSVYTRYLDYILMHSDEDDLVLGEVGDYGWGLRPYANGYYWFSAVHMGAMDYYYFKRRELPDFGNIIKTKRPKIIAQYGWRNCLKGDNKDLYCLFWRNVDFDYLKENYDDVGFAYIRKD